MEIERAVGTALPTLASMLGMPIPQGISRMLITAISPLGGGYYGSRGFGHAVFPASAAAVAGLEFVAGGRDGGRGGASGCSIYLEEFEDGEEMSVMPCSRAHEFHQNCITKWLGMRNIYVPSLPPWTGVCKRSCDIS